MLLKYKIELALKQGRVQGAKKLLTELYKQEDKQAWDEAKRAEYEAIFPTYRTMTKAEKDIEYKKYVKDSKSQGILTKDIIAFANYSFKQVKIEYITTKSITDANGTTSNVEVRTPSNYLTYKEWINETKVVTPAVQEVSHTDVNGIKIIDTPYQPEVTKQIRPYIGLDTTARVDTYLIPTLQKRWKQDRQAKVDAIEVIYKGIIYQGDETSQTRMTKAITALPDNVTTIPWTAKDNTVSILTKLDLQAILLDAGTQQSVLWNTGRI